MNRMDFDAFQSVESTSVVNQSSCYLIDLSHLTEEQRDWFLTLLEIKFPELFNKQEG